MSNAFSIDTYIPFIENSKLTTGDKIVFCDIEGTLFRDSLLVELYEHLRTSQTGVEYREYLESKEKWKNRRIKYNAYIQKAVNLFHDTIVGMDYDYINGIAMPIIENAYRRVYLFTKTYLKKYRAAGYKVVFISGSPHFMVNYFTKKYKFDLGLGTIYHIDNNNCFNGNWESLASKEGKEAIVKYIIDTYKPEDVIGFGDSPSDMSILNASSIGFAVNPVIDLFEIVKDMENINVVFERKEFTIILPYSSRRDIEYINWIDS